MDGDLQTDLAYYQENTIWCKDGLKSFPRERLNDNFCDCADGTDEPGKSVSLIIIEHTESEVEKCAIVLLLA